MSKNGTQTELEPSPDGAATVVPTFAPAQHERAMNTRSASAAHDRRARTVQVACRLAYNKEILWLCACSTAAQAALSQMRLVEQRQRMQVLSCF